MTKTIIEQLEDLYRQLPEIACQGKCQNCCGPIDMSIAERARIRDLGMEIPVMTEERVEDWAKDLKFGRDGKPLWCPALNLADGKCSVYDARPMVCRLWGVSETMPCPHGCKPTKMLTNAEAMDYLMQAMIRGGHSQLNLDEEARQNMQDLLADPEIGPLMAKYVAGDTDVRAELMEMLGSKGWDT